MENDARDSNYGNYHYPAAVGTWYNPSDLEVWRQRSAPTGTGTQCLNWATDPDPGDLQQGWNTCTSTCHHHGYPNAALPQVHATAPCGGLSCNPSVGNDSRFIRTTSADSGLGLQPEYEPWMQQVIPAGIHPVTAMSEAATNSSRCVSAVTVETNATFVYVERRIVVQQRVATSSYFNPAAHDLNASQHPQNQPSELGYFHGHGGVANASHSLPADLNPPTSEVYNYTVDWHFSSEYQGGIQSYPSPAGFADHYYNHSV